MAGYNFVKILTCAQTSFCFSSENSNTHILSTPLKNPSKIYVFVSYELSRGITCKILVFKCRNPTLFLRSQVTLATNHLLTHADSRAFKLASELKPV